MAQSAQNRLALIIASYQYQDPDLRQLVAPAQDAEAMARVLEDPAIGGFQVQTLLNQPSYKVNQAVEAFFIDRKRNDLLLLYYSGHGIKDRDGRLYFATIDTRRKTLRTTAVPANLVNEMMRDSRSRRQVLLLDCCYSGAFAKGMVAKAGTGIGTGERFEGRGRIVLTASDAMQYAFEGDDVQGEGVRSVFTRVLVHGLETGDADLDRDGRISLDELYEYVHDRVTDETPQQRPGKWDFEVQGKIVIALNPALAASASLLPGWIAETLASGAFSARLAAVGELTQLSQGRDRDLAAVARVELERLSREDEHPAVRSAAAGVLGVAPIGVADEQALVPRVEEEAVALDSERFSVPDVLTITSPIHLELVHIPAGEFLMGSDPAKDKSTHSNERSQHPVHLSEFYIAKYPVTNKQYDTFVRAADHSFPKHWENGKIPLDKKNHPVVWVSWNDALAFCKWLSRETGRNFRLPTEAEWEKAARGTDGRIYPWGNDPPTPELCNFDKRGYDTTPVDQYSPQGDSPYGCADMAGNVWEWTLSLWGKGLTIPDFGYPYNPDDGREDVSASERIYRIWRGGAMHTPYTQVRCASRSKFNPGFQDGYLGFRVALVLFE